MSLNLVDKINDCLRLYPDRKLTAREIALWIVKSYPEACREKQERSMAEAVPLDSEVALVQQIVAEIGSSRPRAQKKYPGIKTTEGRPRRYYHTPTSDSDEVKEVESEENSLKEHDLYPLLADFLRAELAVLVKRIDERRASNTRGVNGNKWLYPDLVGVENLSEDWNREIKDCVREYADKRTRLWSFEVKMLVNRSNVREVFFQTISNSSWANFGYLVAKEIEGADTLKELRLLTSLHGIGFIKLDIDNPSESQIMIPARERVEIDWSAANRLAEENPDFLDYIKRIRQFYQTGDLRPHDWLGG